MEGQIPAISKPATNETKVDPKLRITLKFEQKAPGIYFFLKTTMKKMCF